MDDRKMNISNDVETSMRVFDFPDSEDVPPSKTTSKRKKLSKSKKKSSNDKKEKENKEILQTTSAAESYVVCPMCRLVFSDKIDDEARAIHISKCKGTVDKPIEVSSAKNDDITDDSDVCPVCNKKFLPQEKESDRQIHINKCLDLNMNITEPEANDELLARTLQNEESLNVGSSSKIEDNFCQMCYKNMSKFTLQQKTRHLNDCMDKCEKFEGKSKRSNPTRRAKSTKPKSSKTEKKQCPICKAEQPANKLNAHMKKCANKKKISTHQLLQIIRDHKIDIGDDRLNENTKDKNSNKKTTTTVVKPDELNIMDKSIIAEHRNLLEAEDETIQSTPTLPRSNIQRNLNIKGSSSSRNEAVIMEDTNFEKKPCPMWDLAAYTMETINRIFLLQNLHHGICDLKNTEELKFEEADNNTRPIPKHIRTTSSVASVKDDDNIINIDSNSNDSFTATQFEKLDILMNLNTDPSKPENENDNPTKTENKSENLQNDGGFILDELDEKIDDLIHRSHDRITRGYSSLVASSVLSDITILCRGSEKISAHKVILATFCELFSKLIIEDGLSSIDLKEFSSKIVTLFMRFIYTGQLPDPSSLSTDDIKELEKLTERFPVDILSEYCKLLSERSKESADLQSTTTNENEIEMGDDFDLNDIVSTFWQNENIEETENIDEDEKNNDNDDDAFSADEIAEMREIFQSQRIIVENEVHDDNETEAEGDDCLFLPDMNKTLEKSRQTSEEEDIRSQLEGNLLGESPRPSRTLSNSLQKEKMSHSPDMFGSSTVIGDLDPAAPPDISENPECKSSLEANPSTSPRAELSVENCAPLHSYNSYSYGSSAYADTEPIDQNTDKETLTSSDHTSKSNIFQDSTLKSQDKNSSVTLKIKSKKQGSSGEISVLNVSNEKPEVIELDEKSQEKMKCKGVAKVGTLLFSQEDFQSILGGYDKTGVVEIDNKDSGSETEDVESDDEKNKTVIAKEVPGNLLDANNQSDVLFPVADADGKKTKECNEDLSKTPDRIDSSPIPLSIDTPCLPSNVGNNSTVELQDQNDSMSNHSLDDIEIPGLDDISVLKPNRVIDNPDEKDLDKENLQESQSNYNPDFTVTSSKVNNSGENIITIEDDTQDVMLANTDFLEMNTKDDIESPCVTKLSKMATSTPHVLREGITKRKFLMLQNSLNIESPIEKQRKKEISNVVILESPPRSPRSPSSSAKHKTSPSSPSSSIKRKTSPSSSLLRSPQPNSSTKRKVSSSSSTENISSSCESAYVISSQKRARKRARKINETPTVSRTSKVKEIVAETSESSGKDEVSDNESTTNLFKSKKSPFMRTRRPNKSPMKTGNNISSSSWLSKSSQKSTPTLPHTTSRKNTPKQLTSSSKKSKTRKKKKSNVKNADFKELLAKHKKKNESDSSTDSGSDFNTKCTENEESENEGDKTSEIISNDYGIGKTCNVENDSDIESQSILMKVHHKPVQVNKDNLEDEKEIIIEDSQPEQSLIKENDELRTNSVQVGTPNAEETKTNDNRTGAENCGDNGNVMETDEKDEDAVVEDCGDNEYEYDMPYYGDENDMYFMDDGGYNSFVLEMPPGMNSQKNDSTNSNNKNSFLNHSKSSVKSVDSSLKNGDKNTEQSPNNETNDSNGCKSSSISVDSSLKKVGGNPQESRKNEAGVPAEPFGIDSSLKKAKENPEKSWNSEANDSNACLIGDQPADSFNISELNAIDEKVTSMEHPTQTPKGKLLQNQFKTPTNLSVENRKNTNDTYDSENFETPQPQPKDKEACKMFQPGCSKHPETNEAITPMPNFADYPTPALKAEMKKFAIREIAKPKMVAKMIEVYKYQHQFSHWEEEPPPKQTRKRKVKSDQKKSECDENETDLTSTTVQDKPNKPKKSKKSSYEAVCVVEGTKTDDVSNSTETSGAEVGSKKRGKSKKEKKPVASEEELMLYIQGNPKLYQKILSYEPIDFNELVEELEKASMSVINKKMLEKFVDFHCICMKKEEQTKTNTKGRTRRR